MTGMTTAQAQVNGVVKTIIFGSDANGDLVVGHVLTDATGADATGAIGTGISLPTGGAGILGLLSGILQATAGTLKTTPAPMTITPSSVSVGASSTQLIAANSANKMLLFINNGAGPVWITPIGAGIAAAAAQVGFELQPGSNGFGLFTQGCANAWAAISVTGTNAITVWAGN